MGSLHGYRGKILSSSNIALLKFWRGPVQPPCGMEFVCPLMVKTTTTTSWPLPWKKKSWPAPIWLTANILSNTDFLTPPFQNYCGSLPIHNRMIVPGPRPRARSQVLVGQMSTRTSTSSCTRILFKQNPFFKHWASSRSSQTTSHLNWMCHISVIARGFWSSTWSNAV